MHGVAAVGPNWNGVVVYHSATPVSPEVTLEHCVFDVST